MQDETVWLTQAQMVELFQSSKSNINDHIINILADNELDEASTVRFFRTVARNGEEYRQKLYNLDMIISVGYRVKSKRGISFRRWASKILKDFMLQGQAVNQSRLDYIEKTTKIKFK